MNMESPAARKYAVFISYRHADNKDMGRKWANWLHEALESYEVPSDLVGSINQRGEKVPPSLYPVFRDEEELPANADLSTNIRRALENSGLLVVLCSPRAAQSRFVADEIRYFKNLGLSDRILALIIDGEPNASNDPAKQETLGSHAECFPQPLRFGVPLKDDPRSIDWNAPAEPIAADVRPGGKPEQGWTTAAAYSEHLKSTNQFKQKRAEEAVFEYGTRLELAKLKIIAGALALPLGVLTERDKVRQIARARQRSRVLRRWLLAVGALALLAIVGGSLAVIARKDVEKVNSQQKAYLVEASWAEFSRAQRLIADADEIDVSEPKGETARRRKVRESLLHLASAVKFDPDNHNAREAFALEALARRDLFTPFPLVTLRHHGVAKELSYHGKGDFISTNDGSIISDQDDAKNQARLWSRNTGECVGSVNDVGAQAVSPDASLVAAHEGSSGTVRLRELPSGREIATLATDVIAAYLFFSSDSRRLATITRRNQQKEGVSAASPPMELKMWDRGGRLALSIPFENGFYAFFSQDDSRLAVVFSDKTIRILDAASGKLIDQISDNEEIGVGEFSSDDTRILAMVGNKAFRIWNLSSKAVEATLPLQHGYIPNQNGWHSFGTHSPDGTRFVTASRDGAGLYEPLQVWDTASGRRLMTLPHEAAVEDARFSLDGSRLITSSADYTAKIWNLATGEALATLEHDGRLTGGHFSPDGLEAATASWDRTAKVWTAASSGSEMVLSHSAPASAKFSPDGTRVLTSSNSQTAHLATLWDAETGRVIFEFPHDKFVSSAHFSNDGKKVVTAGYDGTAKVWDAQTGLVLATLRHTLALGCASFSPDGNLILTAGGVSKVDQTGKPTAHGMAKVWNLATKTETVSVAHESDLHLAVFSPDGRSFLASGFFRPNPLRRGEALLCETATGKIIAVLHHDAHVRHACFSPDGRLVATAGWDHHVGVWNAADGRKLFTLKHDDAVHHVAFSGDGHHLLTACGDQGDLSSACIWDVQSGRQIARLPHAAAVDFAKFSPDNKRVVTGSGQTIVDGPGTGVVKVWDPATGKELVTLKLEAEAVDVGFSPDGTRVLAACETGKTRIWDLENSRAMAQSHASASDYEILAQALSGMRLSEGGALQSFDVADKAQAQAQLRALARKPGPEGALARWLGAHGPDATISPTSTITRKQRVEALISNGREPEVREASALWPGHPLMQIALAAHEHAITVKSQPETESKAEAESVARRAEFLRSFGVERLPEDPAICAQAAKMLLDQGDNTRSLQVADKSLKLVPNQIEPLRVRASSLARLRRNDESSAAWGAVIAHPDANFTDFTAAGSMAAAANHADETRAIFAAGEQKFPAVPRILRMKARALLLLRDPAQALITLHQYEKALVASDPEASMPADAVACRAVSQWLKGDKDAAVADYQRLIGMVPGYASLAAVTKSDWEEAIKQPMLALLAETLTRHPELAPKANTEK